jgi:putative membrane protein
MIGIRRHPLLSGITAVAIGALGTVGAVRHARLTVPYLVIVLTIGAAVAVAEDRVRFSRVALVGLATWALLHLAGGLIELDDGRILYNTTFTRWIHFDNVVHFIGFGSAGLAATEALVVTTGTRFSRRTTWLITWLAAMGVGAFNEVVEFGASHLLGATNVGGYQNTGRDLVANMLGGAVAGWWAQRG